MQMGHRHTAALQADADSSFSGDVMPVGGLSHGRGRHQHSSGCSTGFLMHLLGFDCFMSSKVANGLAHAGHAANLYNVGIIGNCRDLWTQGSELGVEYNQVYEIPTEGLARGEEEAQARGG